MFPPKINGRLDLLIRLYRFMLTGSENCSLIGYFINLLIGLCLVEAASVKNS